MLREMYYFKEDREGFSSNLKKLIKENGFTSNDVASNLGENYYEILKKWKTGERLPSLDDLSKLSKILNTTMEDLYLPNAQLRINDNEYTNLFVNSLPQLLTSKSENSPTQKTSSMPVSMPHEPANI